VHDQGEQFFFQNVTHPTEDRTYELPHFYLCLCFFFSFILVFKDQDFVFKYLQKTLISQTPNEYNNESHWYNFADTFYMVIQLEPIVDF